MGRPAATDSVWSRDQIAARILAGDNILILRGHVLRVPNSWLAVHPGGALAILHFLGRDATDEVEAFHYDDTIKKMKAYVVGTVDIGEEGWSPLLPPVATGWVRKVGQNGEMRWHNEAQAIRREGDCPSSQILLVKQNEPALQTAPTLSTVLPPPSTLCPKVQAQHSVAYKELHKRVLDAGLYKTPFLSGIGPDVVRYVLFASGSALAYKYGWYMASAVLLGIFWQQLSFFVHDLGHTGVTHNWTYDRLIAIMLADFCGGLSIGWWVDSHNVHHLVTNHPTHDPDIEHLPFFAISTVFFRSIWSSYYKRELTFDLPSRIFVSIQHKLFYVVMSLARFNLYFLSYTYLWNSRNDKKKAVGGRWKWWLEIVGLVVFWSWFGGGVLRGLPSWRWVLSYLLVSHAAASPLHVQIVLSHFSRSTADLGPLESFFHRQLRTTADVICPPSLGWIHGGLHLQITHHLFPRLPRHNLLEASLIVKEFAKEQGLEYYEFGFAEGNGEVVGVLKAVADQVKTIGMVAEGEVKEAMEKI